jgi:hypothetical protein
MLAPVLAVSLLAAAVPALAALPTVNTFTVAATAVSPVPVTAFTASDSDGTVVGYMITQTSTRPSATDARWTSTAWTSFATNSTGAITLYAWAKDNAAGVSSARTAATNVLGGHVHTMAQVTGLTDALAGKAALSHNHDAVYARRSAKVVVVAADGTGDFTSPVDAMNAIADASVANPYLVKIMPGVYSIGAGSVQMKEYVDIEGSGENVTKITGTVSTSYPTSAYLGVVMGANNAELRSLTIENAGPGSLPMSIAIFNGNTSPKISNVTVLSTNGGNWSIGIWNDQLASPTMTNLTISALGANVCQCIANAYGTPTLRNSTLLAVGTAGEIYGIYNGSTGAARISDTTIIVRGGTVRSMGIHNSWDSAPVLTNVTISAPDAIGQAMWNYGVSNATITIDRCTLEGGANSIANQGDNVKIGASKLIGPVAGTVACVGAYNGNLVPLAANCQP